MEHRSRHRVFRIGEIPLEIRAADRRQCDKDECRGGGDRDAKGVQRTALGFPCPCELVVQHFGFFGERLQALGRECGCGLARQRAHRGVEHLSDGDEHLSVGHREPALLFGYRLPYHVQLECELLLREALRFPEGLIFSFSMGGSFLSPGSYVTAMLSADGPLPQATGCNMTRLFNITGGYKLAKTQIAKGAAMSVFDWGFGFVSVATQLLPGVVAVVLALAAAVAARSKAMPALIGASGLAAALSLLGVLMQLQHFARVDNASAWYDTIDVYVACAVVLIVLTFGLNLVALVRSFRNQG